MTFQVSMREGALAEMQRICRDARVFVSMPVLEGVTPHALVAAGALASTRESLPRRQGIFRVDEIGIPVFDHGLLYGDAVFEGVLVSDERLFLWREHLARLLRSAESLGIPVPLGPDELTEELVRCVRETGVAAGDTAYVRLVVTRGLGDLGVHPASCVGSLIYAVAAKVQLYPETAYRRGIGVAVARDVKRTGAKFLDPRVKSCNYLNNILGLLTTMSEGCLETMMLTEEGYVAEATADNVFLVERQAGWERDLGRVRVITPPAHYCLNGITRQMILAAAARLGCQTMESPRMLPSDWMGPQREGFLTGTAAGLMPIVSVAGHPVGDGAPGPITLRLRDELLRALTDPAKGLSIRATRQDVAAYLRERPEAAMA